MKKKISIFILLSAILGLTGCGAPTKAVFTMDYSEDEITVEIDKSKCSMEVDDNGFVLTIGDEEISGCFIDESSYTEGVNDYVNPESLKKGAGNYFTVTPINMGRNSGYLCSQGEDVETQAAIWIQNSNTALVLTGTTYSTVQKALGCLTVSANAYGGKARVDVDLTPEPEPEPEVETPQEEIIEQPVLENISYSFPSGASFTSTSFQQVSMMSTSDESVRYSISDFSSPVLLDLSVKADTMDNVIEEYKETFDEVRITENIDSAVLLIGSYLSDSGSSCEKACLVASAASDGSAFFVMSGLSTTPESQYSEQVVRELYNSLSLSGLVKPIESTGDVDE